MSGQRQIKVVLGAIELTDTDRRALAWRCRGEDLTSAALVDRGDARTFLRLAVEHYLSQSVTAFLDAGGQTASMEAGVR